MTTQKSKKIKRSTLSNETRSIEPKKQGCRDGGEYTLLLLLLFDQTMEDFAAELSKAERQDCQHELDAFVVSHAVHHRPIAS